MYQKMNFFFFLKTVEITNVYLACEQALLFGRVKRASRERASEGRPLAALPLARETRFTRLNRRACSQANVYLPTFSEI